jgi:endonuclease-8
VPEGDTIFKTAAALRPYLVGHQVVRAQARQPGPAIERVVGSSVTAIEPIGKHLVIRFSNGLALHSHLRMNGAWHRYAPGERWKRPVWQARVVLEVPEHVVVCFHAPVMELMEERAVAHHPGLQKLGPDLLAPAFDAGDACARLRARPHTEIAEALLDQRALAGIGNVFKSEILFLCGLDPWLPVSSVPDAALRNVVATAERLLRENSTPGRLDRITTRGDRAARGHVWVYARQGRPCYRCHTQIRARRQGALNRLTYWCPTCQPAVGFVHDEATDEVEALKTGPSPAARRTAHPLVGPQTNGPS